MDRDGTETKRQRPTKKLRKPWPKYPLLHTKKQPPRKEFDDYPSIAGKCLEGEKRKKKEEKRGVPGTTERRSSLPFD